MGPPRYVVDYEIQYRGDESTPWALSQTSGSTGQRILKLKDKDIISFGTDQKFGRDREGVKLPEDSGFGEYQFYLMTNGRDYDVMIGAGSAPKGPTAAQVLRFGRGGVPREGHESTFDSIGIETVVDSANYDASGGNYVEVIAKPANAKNYRVKMKISYKGPD